MTAKAPILAFIDVTCDAEGDPCSSRSGLNLDLHPGEILLVRLNAGAGHRRLPLADLAQGLVSPVRGKVCFRGRDWKAMSPDEAARCRGEMGRVFEGQGWVSNLDVDENVLLAARHHSRRTVRAIEAEALALARSFGLAGLPATRSSHVAPVDLQRAAWVRAFLGAPSLLVLERPVRGLSFEMAQPLLREARSALERGAALICLTRRSELWKGAAVGLCFELSDDGIDPVAIDDGIDRTYGMDGSDGVSPKPRREVEP